MRRKRPFAATAMVALSLVLAAAATLALRGHLARLEARALSRGPLVHAVSAAAGLPRGTTLTPSMVRAARVPEEGLPPGALRTPAEAIGRTLTADVARGELLTALRLARAGPVAALVPAGLRAVPVTVAAPAGSVVPGDRVDVLAVTGDRPFAETVAAEAEVLLVLDAEAPEGLGSAVTLVLLVAPDTASALARARAFSDLSVAIAPAEVAPGPE